MVIQVTMRREDNYMTANTPPHRLAILACVVAVLLTVPACRPDELDAPRVYIQDSDGPVQFYRFDDRVANASFDGPELEDPPYSGTVLEFQMSDPVMWKAEREDSLCQRENGILRFHAKTADAIVSTDSLHVPMDSIRAVIFRAKVDESTRLSLGWRTDGADRYASASTFELPALIPGQWKTFVITTASLPGWEKGDGFLEGLRIHVSEACRLELEFVKLVPDEIQLSNEPYGTVRRMKQNDDRQCIFLRCPGELTFRLKPFPTARFSTGLGLLDNDPPVTCSVVVRDGERTRTIFSKRLDSPHEWNDVNFELGSFTGSEIDFIMRVDAEASGNTVLWSNPIAYQPLNPGRSGTLHRDSAELSPQHPNVVWYVIDALRPDHLEAYGYHRPTAPTIDHLASRGLLFTQCYSPGTWSLPSVTSMLSGANPLTHGVCRATAETVPHDLPLLAETLRTAGYATASVSENPHAAPKSGLGRGLDHAERSYLRLPARGRRRFIKSVALSDATFDAASTFVRDNADRPFFLFVHTVEPHEPYSSPAKFRRFSSPSKTSELPRIDSYDDCIRWADANLRRFLSMLEEVGVRDNTLLIVCADHGEGFTEEEGGTGHSGKPYFARIHVPLLMHWPGRIPQRRIIDSNVQLLDIPSTLLDVTGLSKPSTFEGMSLKPLLMGEELLALETRGIFTIGQDPTQTAWIQGDRLLVSADNERTLFDLSGDPQRPIRTAPGAVEETRRLASDLDEYLSRYETTAESLDSDHVEEEIVVDAGELEQLKALGYAG